MCIKYICVWYCLPWVKYVYSTVRGYDTPSVPVHHRQVLCDTTWLNFTKGYPTWMYPGPGFSRGNGARHEISDGLTVGWLYLDIECYRRTAAVCVDIRYTISTPSPGIIWYGLAQLYQRTPYLNVPGTWYLSWKPDTKYLMGWSWVDYISTSNVIVTRLLCA